MQQFHKFITWRLCVSQPTTRILGVSTPIISSLQLHEHPLALPCNVVVAALLVAATTRFQGKTRGC
jgi:hypothetical protein